MARRHGFDSRYRPADGKVAYRTNQPRLVDNPPLYLNDAQLVSEYQAFDSASRSIYVIDPIKQRPLRYDIDKGRIRYLADLPQAARAGKDSTIPVWDSVNKCCYGRKSGI
jgi:hypothetical protein